MSSCLLKQRFCSLFLALVSVAAAVVTEVIVAVVVVVTPPVLAGVVTELIDADVFVASPVIVSAFPLIAVASGSVVVASFLVHLVCPSALLKRHSFIN